MRGGENSDGSTMVGRRAERAMGYYQEQSAEVNERKRQLQNWIIKGGYGKRSWETSREEARKSIIINERVEIVKKDRSYDCEGKKKKKGERHGGGELC
mmetsp:Transcript_25746/g.75961  ORF Transcript_25746/g.75961 Transcript_25746/m.75961 type:complete len:98 (-) Transcript_25746:52-345(-)|eukprot:CAMPEP_0113550822 /NCGR_PEP_ID=MMETSP0015_2-20120614/14190_1 /TAXON_ID=2838 /ORGANISM="Odontella" /LENGTH=97 /DNA_ID=CAMNT_0000451661 /DNA_START=453 /DNA_END=746 /DNA_ORIENTATION=+ /assembly_acc=CAM_ASM_000160